MKDTKRVGTRGVTFLKPENKNTVKTYRHIDFTFQKTYPHTDFTFQSHWSNGLVVKALDSQSRSPVFKTTAFHPSEVDKMSTRNFWELSGKK